MIKYEELPVIHKKIYSLNKSPLLDHINNTIHTKNNIKLPQKSKTFKEINTKLNYVQEIVKINIDHNQDLSRQNIEGNSK